MVKAGFDRPGLRRDSCIIAAPQRTQIRTRVPRNPMTSWLDEVRWNEQGLVPCVAEDVRTGRPLMVAWMSREALERTAVEGSAVYWSRSRRRLWRKGEASGNEQRVREIRLDCDAGGARGRAGGRDRLPYRT